MQRILHILTGKDDPLAGEIVVEQRQRGEAKVEIFDLRQPQPDYERLLKEIFEADSVHVW
jgi:hypothetical protein